MGATAHTASPVRKQSIFPRRPADRTKIRINRAYSTLSRIHGFFGDGEARYYVADLLRGAL